MDEPRSEFMSIFVGEYMRELWVVSWVNSLVN